MKDLLEELLNHYSAYSELHAGTAQMDLNIIQKALVVKKLVYGIAKMKMHIMFHLMQFMIIKKQHIR